jgi:O-antigen/teichoic acid export membrane protein
MINFKVISNKILKSPTSKMAAKFTGGNIIVALIGAASAIVYGRWIGPEILGEFNKYGILTGYLTIGIIFVDAAFQRHFPYYLGKNQEKKALEIAAVAHWWFLILFLGGAIIFAILASFNLYIKDFRAFCGWTVQILAFGIMTYGLYLGTLYRSNKDFLKLNKNMLVTAGIGILALPLVYLFNFFGFAFRKILQDLTNLYMLKKHVPFVAKPKFDKAILIGLFKISLPLQIPVYLDTKLLTASIGLIILNTQGEKALGVYAMALMFSGFLMIFSKSLNQIVTTKIALKYGSNDNIKDTFMYIIKPVLKLVLVGILLLLGFVITIDPTVAYFLPKYVDSILIAQILSLELILALIRSPFTLFTSSLMFKSLIIQRGLKVLLTFTLLLFFHDSLTQIALVIIFSNFLNVLYGYFVLYKTIKLK